MIKGIKQLAEVFLSFFKIGCFTFGGGYAMIPLIEREVVVKKGWVKAEDVIDIFAVSESIPGAIAINSSTFIGYKIAGRMGAIAAMLGVVLPSFIIITLIAACFTQFQDNPIVKKAFTGIRAAVVGLIGMAAFRMGKASIRDGLTAGIAAVTVILVFWFNIHAIYVILAGAFLGMALYLLFPHRAEKILPPSGDEKQ